METAVGAYGLPVTAYSRQAVGELLMSPQSSIYNLQSTTRGIVKTKNMPPIVAIEDCREKLGDGVAPNKRRLLSDARRQFPGIDFSLVKHEQDLLFERFDRPEGESDVDIAERVHRLTRFLLDRWETKMAIVSHGHFLNALLTLQETGDDFANAEMRVYELRQDGYLTILRDMWFRPRFGFSMG